MRARFLLLVVVGVAVLLIPASAATSQDDFNAFLASHPVIAGDLYVHPEYLHDAAYLARHPELARFLTAHPGAAFQVPPPKGSAVYVIDPGEGAHRPFEYPDFNPPTHTNGFDFNPGWWFDSPKYIVP